MQEFRILRSSSGVNGGSGPDPSTPELPGAPQSSTELLGSTVCPTSLQADLSRAEYSSLVFPGGLSGPWTPSEKRLRCASRPVSSSTSDSVREATPNPSDEAFQEEALRPFLRPRSSNFKYLQELCISCIHEE
eukprot:11897816-Alexandrium_andersonii.AAC.1